MSLHAPTHSKSLHPNTASCYSQTRPPGDKCGPNRASKAYERCKTCQRKLSVLFFPLCETFVHHDFDSVFMIFLQLEFNLILPAAGNIRLFVVSYITAAWLMIPVSLKCEYTDVQLITPKVCSYGVIFHSQHKFSFPVSSLACMKYFLKRNRLLIWERSSLAVFIK